MALIKCPECGTEISDKAKACPHCGNPMCSGVQTDLENIEMIAAGKDLPKQKSLLKWAILLWPLPLLELIIIIIGVIALDRFPAEKIIVFFLIGNILLSLLLGFKLTKLIRESLSLKTKPNKNIIAMVLCIIFLVLNCNYLYEGIANKGSNAVADVNLASLTEDEKTAVEVCKDYQSRLKNPSSLQIYSIVVCHDADESVLVYIDCSAMNGFGGSTRSIAVYKHGNYLGDLEDNPDAESALSFCKTMGRYSSVSADLVSKYLD